MNIAAVIGWALAIGLFAVSFWVRRQRRIRRRFTTRATHLIEATPVTVMPDASRVLVYIENDGTARELTEAEKKYVDTAFSPFDGARPYVKSSYEQRNGWGELRGYLPRDQVPTVVSINAASTAAPEPQTPEAVANLLFELARKHRPEEAHKLQFKVPPSSD